MAWYPTGIAEACEGESLRIVKGEAGKEVHGGRHALQVKGGKSSFFVYQHESGKGAEGTYRLRFFGRGSGKLTLLCWEYYRPNPNHARIQTYDLGPQWQEFTGAYKASPELKADGPFNIVLYVPPDTVATLDDFAFWRE
jgi:hypothetical protein